MLVWWRCDVTTSFHRSDRLCVLEKKSLTQKWIFNWLSRLSSEHRGETRNKDNCTSWSIFKALWKEAWTVIGTIIARAQVRLAKRKPIDLRQCWPTCNLFERLILRARFLPESICIQPQMWNTVVDLRKIMNMRHMMVSSEVATAMPAKIVAT